MSEHPNTSVKEKTVLVLDITSNITESPKPYYSQNASLSLYDTVKSIQQAAKDNHIIGILIKETSSNQDSNLSLVIADEVLSALEGFKATGKKIIAYLNHPSSKHYLLASIADKIFMHPFGVLDFKGLGAEITYYNEALEKYGIGVQTVRVGQYKSAIEPFTRKNMSAENREQITQLLNDIWNHLLKRISLNRNLTVDKLNGISKEDGLLSAAQAKEKALIDDLIYEEEALNHFFETKTSNASIHKLTLPNYAQNKKLNEILPHAHSKIAVLYLEGDIINGKSRSSQIGAKTWVKQLKKVRDDTAIQAVVLRINSPGGSAFASEEIQYAIRNLKTKKPVVASFSSYAASGGYWIACYTDALFTNPMTVTGSIGSFGLFFNIQKIANNHGIYFDKVTISPLADIFSIGEPKSEKALEIFQKNNNFFYNAFIYKVAEGRQLEPETVAQIAKGRVWSGQLAVELGLADKFGGLNEAIQEAARLANLKNFALKHIPYNYFSLSDLLAYFTKEDWMPQDTLYAPTLKKEIKKFTTDITSLTQFDDPGSLYARLPFYLKFY